MPSRHIALTATFVAALAIALPGAAQAKSDPQYWQALSASVKLGDKVVLSNDTIVRSSDGKGLYQVIDHLLIGYKLSKKLTVSAGYTLSLEHSHGSFTTTEHRLREQLSTDNLLMLGKAKLSGRVRMEERWRDGFTGTGWRLIPMAKLAVPLSKKLTLNLSEEAFFNLNTTGFQKGAGLSRLRSAVSLAMPVARHFTLELGGVEQYDLVPGADDAHDPVMTVKVIAAF